MIDRIEHRGKLIDDCTIAGERRKDMVAPAHGNGIQVARDRFLVLNSTLGFRGVDDNRSIVWQLRQDGYDGPVIKEGVFAQSIDNWYPLGDRYRCVRQLGCPCALGVPKGAQINGKPAVNANVFAIKWRIVGRVFVPGGGYIMWTNEPKEVRANTQDVYWLQFRLRDDGNDLEILQEAQPLRQVGYEQGEAICELGPARMNQSYVQPVPYNAGATEWVDVNSFGLHAERTVNPGHAGRTGSHVAPLRYRFNQQMGLYEWVQTGPPIGPNLFEGNISPYHGDWLIAARREGAAVGVAWTRVNDPFSDCGPVTISDDVRCAGTPLTVYRCPDGVPRLLAGDGTISPHKSHRNPIYMWDIDPENSFRASHRREIFDTFKGGVPIPEDHGPMVDMIKLLPHTGGKTQKLIHRVRTCAMAVTEADYPSRIRPLTDGDFTGTAIYHADVYYSDDLPPTWEFGP